MPSSTRQTTSHAVRTLRDLRTALSDRRCHDLLILRAAEALVGSSEALSRGVAHLDEALVVDIKERTRVAIASLGTLDLHGDAPGVEQIADPVGQLICRRQLPSVYLCHLLAATLLGVEEGVRSLLLGTATTAAEPPAPPKRARTPRRSAADEPLQTPTFTPVVPTTDASIPDTAAADLFDRPSRAPATVSDPSSGRLEIKRDTERI